MSKRIRVNRRGFLRAACAATGAAAFPAIVPSTVFGANAPNSRIQVGVVGCGRKGLSDLRHAADLRDRTRVVALCDVDTKRLRRAKSLVDDFYGDNACAVTGDYRELIARDDLDAVLVSTPDHWHVLPVTAAAEAGKAVFVQKPLSLTIEEGRAMADAAARHNTVFQVGSQLRSDPKFAYACRLVREGAIGALERVDVGLPTDPGCGEEPVMPVPDSLDYDFWLGPTPDAPYTEKRVHPQDGYGRPGWLRLRAYGAGMITGWGTHQLDIAHWAMGVEHGGPVSCEGWAEFPESGLWDVHGDFDLTYMYANGVPMRVAANSIVPQGVRFTGEDGWVFISRGEIQTEPADLMAREGAPESKALTDDVDAAHMENFIDAIRNGGETLAPAEVGHRSCSVCLIGAIAMELGRKVRWNPETERFVDDPEADARRSRVMRAPWRL